MKIQAYDVHELPQEAIDLLEDVRTLLNYGKYQNQVVTAGPPTWTGRLGEEVVHISGTTGAFYMCTTDQTTTWRITRTFNL